MTPNPARAALALDDLLSTPAGRAVLGEAARHAPTWFADQAGAAAADAVRWLEFEATFMNAGKVGNVDRAEVPDWIRLGVTVAWTTWVLGRGSTCLHSPTVDRPEPVFATAWQPGLIACSRCIHLTVLRPGSVADRTCDGCGHVVAGLDDGEGIHPGRVQFGPLLYAYGTCPGCVPVGIEQPRKIHSQGGSK